MYHSTIVEATPAAENAFEELQPFAATKVFRPLLLIALCILALSFLLRFTGFQYYWVITLVGGILTLVFGIFNVVFTGGSMLAAVNKKGIEVLFRPSGRTSQIFEWQVIESLAIAKNPRIGTTGNKWIYGIGQLTAINNREGIQLILKNGKKVFIGSNKASAFYAASGSFFNAKPNPQSTNP